jgi:hypothetical protein
LAKRSPISSIKKANEMSIEFPEPVPQIIIAETPDGREFMVNGEATLRAIVASAVSKECKVVRVAINDESELGDLGAQLSLQSKSAPQRE